MLRKKKRTAKEMGEELLEELSKPFDCNTGRVLKLIADGADINATSGAGDFTPLMWAVKHGHIGCIKALVDAGAEIEKVSMAYGVDSVGLARNSGRSDIAVFLEGELEESRAAKTAELKRVKAEKAKARREEKKRFLRETDCARGVSRPVPAPKTIHIKGPG